ncbi:MAG TPA: glycosyltransferase family 39 protein [Bryobacteraceae bacterium]|nr:glycosyltransferase family 39 protein [Bryobacteraceae bacterium]HUO33307.1 glycosyltransferase family 39 protein [Bryobacteraceae bacterium]
MSIRAVFRPWQLAVLQCAVFLLLGQAFVPRLGVEADEAVFAGPFFAPRDNLRTIQLGHSHFPLMVMDYIGTFKTLLYQPVVRTLRMNVWVLREPVLLAGALTIWLFYLLLRRCAGERAALAGCSLLAFDSVFLLTTCFDWGPVALQHLLLTAGMFFLVVFAQTRRDWWLMAGFFTFGLAMWDKAVAAWMLSGIAVAGVAVFGRQIRSLISRRRAAISVVALLMGCLPLILYNVRTKGSTFRSDNHAGAGNVSDKALILLETLRGEGLFGYLTAEDSQTPRPHPPEGLFQRAAFGVSECVHHSRHNWMLYGLVLAVLLAPITGAGARRAILFSVSAMAITWSEMVLVGGGGAVHHAILLWPLPALMMGVIFAGASRQFGRASLAAVVILLAASQLAVTNEYYVQMVRNGARASWTDAIFPLANYAKATPARQVFCLDWGMLEGLRLLSDGRLPLRQGYGGITKAEAAAMVADPSNIFVGHTQNAEIVRGNAEELIQFASESGYSRRLLAVISDSYGRPEFEVFRFAREP